MSKSMLDAAYELMAEKKSIAFSALWNAVCKKMNLSSEEAKKKIANFYTQLSLDGRFVALGNNKWSLRDQLPYDKVHVDLSDFYKDIEEGSDDDDESEESNADKKDDVTNNDEESFN